MCPQRDPSCNTLRPGDFPMDQRNHRRTLILANSFEFLIAVAGLLGALILFAYPSVRDGTASGLIGFSFGIQWALLYLFGSLSIIIGLWRAEDRLEVVGLILLASATLVNGISLIQVKGFPAPGTYISFQFFGFSIACSMRVFLLLRLRRVYLALGKQS